MSEPAMQERESAALEVSTAKEAKSERELSTIDFPYNSLEDAILVAKAIHKLGGNECRIETLAGELGHETAKSGGFRQKLSSAHTFGLTGASAGIALLTPLGGRIIDQDQERAARVEAFLTVPLYAAIYEEFKAGTLPPPSGLEAKMVSLGVTNKQKEKARQVFQRSAKEAGFFAYGSTKLVYPAVSTAAPVKPKVEEGQPEHKRGGGNGGGGGGHHPLIEGLIGALPSGGEWSFDQRRKWLQAAAMNFDFVYSAAPGDTGVIKVSVGTE